MLQLNMHGKGLTQTVNLAHAVVYAVHLLKGAQITTLPQKKTAFSSSAPDLLRPLMQIESIAIFQLEYLRRNRSPTCHSRVLKTTEDADDGGERRSCARARDVSGAARSFKCIYGSIQDPSSSSLFHQAVIRSFTNLLVLLISFADIWTKKNAP